MFTVTWRNTEYKLKLGEHKEKHKWIAVYSLNTDWLVSIPTRELYSEMVEAKVKRSMVLSEAHIPNDLSELATCTLNNLTLPCSVGRDINSLRRDNIIPHKLFNLYSLSIYKRTPKLKHYKRLWTILKNDFDIYMSIYDIKPDIIFVPVNDDPVWTHHIRIFCNKTYSSPLTEFDLKESIETLFEVLLDTNDILMGSSLSEKMLSRLTNTTIKKYTPDKVNLSNKQVRVADRNLETRNNIFYLCSLHNIDTEMCIILLKKGVNILDNDGMALCNTAEEGDLSIVKLIGNERFNIFASFDRAAYIFAHTIPLDINVIDELIEYDVDKDEHKNLYMQLALRLNLHNVKTSLQYIKRKYPMYEILTSPLETYLIDIPIITLKKGVTLYHHTTRNLGQLLEDATQESKRYFETLSKGEFPTSLADPKYFSISRLHPLYYSSNDGNDVYLKYKTNKPIKLFDGRLYNKHRESAMNILACVKHPLVSDVFDGWVIKDDINDDWYEIYLFKPSKFVGDYTEIAYSKEDKAKLKDVKAYPFGDEERATLQRFTLEMDSFTYIAHIEDENSTIREE